MSRAISTKIQKSSHAMRNALGVMRLRRLDDHCDGKPIKEILAMIASYQKIVLAGCKGV